MRRGAVVLWGLLVVTASACGGAATRDRATPVAATQPSHQTAATVACPPTSQPREESRVRYDQLPPTPKAQVDRVRIAWAHKFPTAADAVKAGWFKSTPSLYGIGAHYVKSVKGFSVAAPFDPMRPPILLYDGEGPDAKFAGLSYVVKGNVRGFAGCYDVWHTHKSVCIDKQHRITLTEPHSWRWYSESECRANGGFVMPLAADKMIHVWIGRGYTNAPIFAHDNPKLYDGYYPKHGA